MSCTRRAEFESVLEQRRTTQLFVFTTFLHFTTTDQNIFITFSTSNTTTAHTQMDLPFVGVQGHQKPLENTGDLMKIDVLGCLAVQEPGVPGTDPEVVTAREREGVARAVAAKEDVKAHGGVEQLARPVAGAPLGDVRGRIAAVGPTTAA